MKKIKMWLIASIILISMFNNTLMAIEAEYKKEWIKTIDSDGMYISVVAVNDAYIAVGVESDRAVIVKYNSDGTIAWKHNMVGSEYSGYESVVAVNDGYIAAGFESTTAIIVKYNSDGTIAWKHNSVASENSGYISVVAVNDGYIAAGYDSNIVAVIVKYNLDGTIAWKHNSVASGESQYTSVVAVNDGYIAVGFESDRAVIVKYNSDGTIAWKKEDMSSYAYDHILALSDGYIVVGYYKSETLNQQSVAVKYDFDGTIIWERKIKKDNTNILAESAVIVSDGILINAYENVEYEVEIIPSITKLNFDGTIEYEQLLDDEGLYRSIVASNNSVILVGCKVDLSVGEYSPLITKYNNSKKDESPGKGTLSPDQTNSEKSPETSDINLILITALGAASLTVIAAYLYKLKKGN